jgi:hypothetical protein
LAADDVPITPSPRLTATAARAVDDDRAPRRQAEQVEHPDGGLPGHGEPRGDLERHLRRLRHPGAQHGVLGRRRPAEAEHRVAGLHAVHAGADLVDHPGGLHAGPGRPGGPLAAGHQAGDQLPVERVDARRTDGDPHLPRPGVRLLHLPDVQHVGLPVLRVDDGAHPALLPDGGSDAALQPP